MRVLVVGCGSMGLRHVRNLLALGHEVWVYDEDETREMAARDVGANTAAQWKTRMAFDATVLATPPSVRSRATYPVFIEKPLALSVSRAERISAPLLQVGYNLRFDPELRTFREEVRAFPRILSVQITYGQSLATWREGMKPEDTPYAQTGILLEASHELDLLRWIFGEATVLGAWVGQRGEWNIPAEDTAIAVLEAGGVPIELHLDMTLPGYTRAIEVVTPAQVLRWELDRTKIEETYLAEMQAFIRLVETREYDPCAATFNDGVAALRLVEAIKAKAMVPA